MDHFLNGTAIKRFRMVWLVIPYWIAIYGVLLWKSEKNDLRSAIFSDAGSLYRILTPLSVPGTLRTGVAPHKRVQSVETPKKEIGNGFGFEAGLLSLSLQLRVQILYRRPHVGGLSKVIKDDCAVGEHPGRVRMECDWAHGVHCVPELQGQIGINRPPTKRFLKTKSEIS